MRQEIQPRKRDQVFKKLEDKVSTVRDLWQCLETLLPLSGDSSEQRQQDIGIVKGFLYKLSDRYPDQTALYPQYRQLDTQFEEVSKRYGQYCSIPREQRSEDDGGLYAEYSQRHKELLPFLFNSDFMFIASIINGVTSVIQARNEARGLLGKRNPDWENPRLYDDELPGAYEIFKGHILAIMPGRFSITFLTRQGVFDKHLLAIGHSLNVQAFHSKDLPLFNFARGRSDGMSTQYWQTKQKEATHEDFHALMGHFLTAFKHQGSLGANYQKEYYGEWFSYSMKFYAERELNPQRLKMLRPYFQDSFRRTALRNFRGVLEEIIDADHEELIADLVSEPIYNVPSSTYVGRATLKASVLKGIAFEDPSARDMVATALKAIDAENLKSRIRMMHQFVHKANPDKIQDLRAALIILPPSKKRHLESLIERWTPNVDEQTRGLYTRRIRYDL